MSVDEMYATARQELDNTADTVMFDKLDQRTDDKSRVISADHRSKTVLTIFDSTMK